MHVEVEKIMESHWLPAKKLIVTQISGDVNKEDIEKWEQSLYKALNAIPDNSVFSIFINMYGFKAVDLDAHKAFRTIVPTTLARYNWKVGYVNLFEDEARKMSFESLRGITCTGAAHVHQDETKMNLYESRFSSTRERFFDDVSQARTWIEALG
jgi:hypothetical protein